MPFLDVVTNERDTSLPLTAPEWEEWGDPLHNATDYQYMLTYSPVDNIRKCAQLWAHILVAGGGFPPHDVTGELELPGCLIP